MTKISLFETVVNFQCNEQGYIKKIHMKTILKFKRQYNIISN